MRIRFLAAVSLIAISLSACQSIGPADDAISPAAAAPLRADVNTDYKAGQTAIPTKPTDSLDQIMAKTGKAEEKKKDEDQEDKLRLPAMQEAASSYGARAGLAFRTREINKTLEDRANELTKIYDFQRLMIQGPNDVMVSPPVIVEAEDAWESSDAGKTLRVADKVYEIIDQARFTSTAPMWQNYLIVNFDAAEEPPEQLRPRNDDEVKIWKKSINEGWAMGVQQADDTNQANLDRLNRDFNGMVRYRKMIEECKVTAPMVVNGTLGTTGTGQTMRENDHLNRITQDALLNVSSKCWNGSVTTTDNTGNIVGIPVNQAAVQPITPSQAPAASVRPTQPVKPRQRHVAHQAPTPVAAKPVYQATSGGKDRF